MISFRLSCKPRSAVISCHMRSCWPRAPCSYSLAMRPPPTCWPTACSPACGTAINGICYGNTRLWCAQPPRNFYATMARSRPHFAGPRRTPSSEGRPSAPVIGCAEADRPTAAQARTVVATIAIFTVPLHPISRRGRQTASTRTDRQSGRPRENGATAFPQPGRHLSSCAALVPDAHA